GVSKVPAVQKSEITLISAFPEKLPTELAALNSKEIVYGTPNGIETFNTEKELIRNPLKIPGAQNCQIAVVEDFIFFIAEGRLYRYSLQDKKLLRMRAFPYTAVASAPLGVVAAVRGRVQLLDPESLKEIESLRIKGDVERIGSL